MTTSAMGKRLMPPTPGEILVGPEGQLAEQVLVEHKDGVVGRHDGVAIGLARGNGSWPADIVEAPGRLSTTMVWFSVLRMDSATIAGQHIGTAQGG